MSLLAVICQFVVNPSDCQFDYSSFACVFILLAYFIEIDDFKLDFCPGTIDIVTGEKG